MKSYKKLLTLLGVLAILVLLLYLLFGRTMVVHASSITDVMEDWSSTNTPDAELMEQGGSFITKFFGTLTSIAITLLFALSALTTVVDLIYIGVPASRTFLYDATLTNGSATDSRFHSFLHDSANNWVGLANKAAMRGDAESYNRRMGLAARDEAIANQHERDWSGTRIKSTGSATGATKCLISTELKTLVNEQGTGFNVKQHDWGNIPNGVQNQYYTAKTTSGSLLTRYLKKRVVSLVFLSVCVILFTSSIFTDCGINIGQFIFKYLLRIKSFQ